jgi:monoamine oxidase
MEALGQVAPTSFAGPPKLTQGKRGASVLVLGAGLAGLTAAYELRKAGYKVRVLEFQERIGGRCWTLRGGDTVSELGGATQKVAFAPNNYFNAGPWRIPGSHRGVLHYCRELGVELETFVATNGNAFVHSRKAYGGKPQRYREVANDMIGHISELLAKAADAQQLDRVLTSEDRDRLIAMLRGLGRLDDKLSYSSNLRTASRRGFERWPGAGANGAPTPSAIAPLHDVLDPLFWRVFDFNHDVEMLSTVFQPVGGMDMIARAFAERLEDCVTLNSRVTRIAQDEKSVTVDVEDMRRGGTTQVKADWCVCAMPLQPLSQIEVQVPSAMLAAIRAVPYAPHVKIGLEFRRRFWEQDEAIYGGSSYTDQPITTIAYPNDRFNSSGPAVLLGAYPLDIAGFDLGGMTPEQRIETALAQGEVIHPQYRKEFIGGVSVAWSRVPWMLGCRAIWSQETRQQHYQHLIDFAGRIVLAGDHCSHLHGWQEGAIVSSLDAVTRLHERAVGGAL